jgi:predicted 2-oxoglutarate/Fe(II)-dependent dioxygenase YbiX
MADPWAAKAMLKLGRYVIEARYALVSRNDTLRILFDSDRRKLAGSVQLSHPGDYDGGGLMVHFGPRSAALPWARRTLAVFPAWSVHEVTPVTRGERWSLHLNGLGPPAVSGAGPHPGT